MGAGYHGGFGSTSGSKKSFKIGYIEKNTKHYTKDELIESINGITDISTTIAKMIKTHDIKLSVLGDSLFDRYLDTNPKVLGLAVENKIYLRASAANIISNLVHEGTHAIDSINNISSNIIRSWKGEYKAYMAEHNFQKAKGLALEFENEDEIMVHIALNYKEGDK